MEDKIELYGQQTRLRIFVWSENGYVNANLPVNCIESIIDNACGKKRVWCETRFNFEIVLDSSLILRKSTIRRLLGPESGQSELILFLQLNI